MYNNLYSRQTAWQSFCCKGVWARLVARKLWRKQKQVHFNSLLLQFSRDQNAEKALRSYGTACHASYIVQYLQELFLACSRFQELFSYIKQILQMSTVRWRDIVKLTENYTCISLVGVFAFSCCGKRRIVCLVADPAASDEAEDNEKVKKKQKTDKRKATTRVTFFLAKVAVIDGLLLLMLLLLCWSGRRKGAGCLCLFFHTNCKDVSQIRPLTVLLLIFPLLRLLNG